MKPTDVLAGITLEALAGQGQSPVVVVDFVKISDERSIGQILSEELPGQFVLRIDVVADLGNVTGEVTLEQLGEAYAAKIIQHGHKPAAIVGYCSAAPLAMAIEKHLATLGAGAEVLLIAPAFPDLELISTEFAELRQGLGIDAEPGSIPDSAPAAMAHIEAQISADIATCALANEMSEFEAELLDQELGRRYRAWMGYLVLSAFSPAVQPSADLTVVACADMPFTTPLDWPAGSHQVILQTPRAALLDDDLAGRRIADLLLKRA